MAQLEIYNPLQIKSDYHSVNYTSKNLDTWMYTNSTEVTLSYGFDRLGQLRVYIDSRL